jgi:hypothetical protein
MSCYFGLGYFSHFYVAFVFGDSGVKWEEIYGRDKKA